MMARMPRSALWVAVLGGTVAAVGATSAPKTDAPEIGASCLKAMGARAFDTAMVVTPSGAQCSLRLGRGLRSSPATSNGRSPRSRTSRRSPPSCAA
jgi:hypothetical protein